MEYYKHEIIVLLAMIYCHIIDDYYLQGILANLKQRIWWLHNGYSQSKYQDDYLMALFEHAFSWSFTISIPAAIYLYATGGELVPLLLMFLPNLFAHAIIDELKANEFRINLIQDQTLHIIQVLITWHLIVL